MYWPICYTVAVFKAVGGKLSCMKIGLAKMLVYTDDIVCMFRYTEKTKSVLKRDNCADYIPQLFFSKLA